MAFNTAKAAREYLTANGYRLIPGKWWQNDEVPGVASCLNYSQAYDGTFKIYPA